MGLISVFLFTLLAICLADKDDAKWRWKSNSRHGNPEARSFNDEGPYQNSYPGFQGGRQTPNNRYYPDGPEVGYGGRPGASSQETIPIYEHRPQPSGGGGYAPDERPHGIYGGANRPTYGNAQGPYLPESQQQNPGILTGPVPSWVKEGPVKQFDRCKCTEKFNCNTPGISYGHCDTGKQYCCYSTNKHSVGGPVPSRPEHSIENGILVGPGGPVDPIPGVNAFSRPPQKFGVGGGLYRPNGFRGQNEYSPDLGVLVGPGGPHRGGDSGGSPGGHQYGLGRSGDTGSNRRP